MRIRHAKKFSLLVICLMLLTLMLSACYVKTDAESDLEAFFNNPESRMISVDSGIVGGCNFIIFKDADTGVHYLFVTAGYKGGLSVLYNSDGTPYIGAKMDGGNNHAD